MIGQSAVVVPPSKLRTQGFIKGEPHSTDKRATLLCLTESGRQIVNHAKPIIYEINDKALAGYSNKQRVLLGTLMQHLLASVRGSNAS